jgi:hypothetical protein
LRVLFSQEHKQAISMSLRSVLLSLLLLSISVNRGIAGPVRWDDRISALPYWSIISKVSKSDSLNQELTKQRASSGIRVVKEYLNTLQFRAQLKASDNIPYVFPTSAGVL